MTDDTPDEQTTDPASTPIVRVRMPIADRIPPEEWSAEHPDDPPPAELPSAAAERERLRSLPWGYR